MKSIYKVLGVAATFLLLQSCFVAKDYEEPDNIIVEEEYYRTDQLPQDSLNMADMSWSEIFTDSYLRGYIDTALSNNVDIRIALQQIAAAEAYVKQGKAGYWPSLNAGTDYTLNYPSKNGSQGALLSQTGSDHVEIFNLSGNLSWEADVWGKIRSQKRAFDASFLQTVAAHQAVKTGLVARVAETYYRLLAIDKQIEVTEQTVDTRFNSLETTRSLKEAGAGNITSTAVQQTEAQYLDAKSMLIDLKNQARLLENVMSLLMGEEPHSIERSKLDQQNITTELKVGVPIELLSNRPDVIMAENGYRQAFEMTNVAKANFYPSFTIGAQGGVESLKLDNWFDANSLFANILGGITAPIFNGRQIRTQFEVSKIQQEQARLDYRGALLVATKEVSDALYNYEAASEKIDIKRDQRELLEQAVEDSQALLQSGYNNFSYLEVLTAQESVLNSSIDVINAELSQLNSMIDLYEALGGGWK